MKSHGKKFSSALTRRNFLKTASFATGALAFGVPTLLRAQNLNRKLNLACIGVMGKGESDTNICGEAANIVALCDVDAVRAGKQREKYPDAKFFQDYRQLFAEASDKFDAVTVSTPDHMHAIIASLAMSKGKHIYCQKPLVQTIHEARYLKNLAEKNHLVTQMGNQGSSADGLRRAVEVIQAGLIGRVHEVHIWTNRPVWPQGMERPDGADEIPAGLDWDTWLGCAPMRPFKKGVYHPFKWRGWLDFGTGALGDMACHTVNMPFRALQLGHPDTIEAVTELMPKESYPLGSKIHFEFPSARKSLFDRHTAFTWYDGGKADASAPNGHDFSNKPPKELLTDIVALQGEVPNSACLLIGSEGKIFSPDDYGEQFFVKLNGDKKYVHYKKHPSLAKIPQTIPRNEFKGDSDHRHHLEWIDAVKKGKPELCYSRFAIGAQLTEIMLLGCVALRVGKKIEWDGENMRAKNCPEAEKFIKRENRNGWALS
jgi:Oxidoreductase family, NAD-binding Rossmann fold/Oxidoreductase family, C-terminal alpha/beta domain